MGFILVDVIKSSWYPLYSELTNPSIEEKSFKETCIDMNAESWRVMSAERRQLF